jgi:amino acid transporter
MRKTTGQSGMVQVRDLPESVWYKAKRRLLGPPIVNDELSEQRLSKTLALGVLSPDGISSSAYGTEEILIELLPLFGLGAFMVILPMTGVVLVVMLLVVLLYRDVVTIYTRAGGSYVVARENFGPRIAQIAAVALLIDYVVTVDVQTAAGTAAVASAFPALSNYQLPISVGMILLMTYGNLRGIREAGKVFALPTYLFSGTVIVMILFGIVREIAGDLPQQNVHDLLGLYKLGHGTSGIAGAVIVFTLLRSFANGGSSLTGIEAVSNAVSAFRPPEGINARKVLVMEGAILGFLVAGISWLAHLTHAAPYVSGVPTVISQEANVVFGHGGHFMFYVIQASTALILYTGGNTSFNGFPFLTSFVAEDSFLPRWMTKRGQRLVFSNGIIVLTVASIALMLAVGSNVNRLVPFYAIGVFTAFSMAGFGMARYHSRRRDRGWRRRMILNFTTGVMTSIVVVIFAVVKFTEGAWLIVIVFPVLVFALIRLNREYRAEAHALEAIGERRAAGQGQAPPNYTRRLVIVFVDDFDLATIAALRYAKSLRPTNLRAVHFVIDSEQAEKLRAAWLPDRSVTLEFIDCPDRRLSRAALELVSAEAETPGTHVTVILPRRGYSQLIGRMLHDRTADKIAAVVSRVPNAAATIIPFDVQNRLQVLQRKQAPVLLPTPERSFPRGDDPPGDPPASGGNPSPQAPSGTPFGGPTPIGDLRGPGRAIVEGRVRVLEIRPVDHNSVLAVEISDSTGDLTALFYGRSRIPGLMCGGKVRLRGQVGIKDGGPVMINPAYELLIAGTGGT